MHSPFSEKLDLSIKHYESSKINYENEIENENENEFDNDNNNDNEKDQINYMDNYEDLIDNDNLQKKYNEEDNKRRAPLIHEYPLDISNISNIKE